MNTQQAIEIWVHFPDDESSVGPALWLLEQAGIVVQTWCRCYDDYGLVLMLTTSEPQSACQLLESARYYCETEPVLLVGPMAAKPHLAAGFSSRLMRDGIDITYSHVASAGTDRWFLVLKTTNDGQAASLAQEESAFETVREQSQHNLFAENGQGKQPTAFDAMARRA